MHSSSPILTNQSLSFGQYIWRVSVNRKYLFWGLGLIIVQFIIFKILYPFPDFISDSYSYIFAASTNLDVNIWPIGYSKFLYAFHQLTHSDTALVAFQYFFLELSALYFFFTFLYFYQPFRKTSIILFVFLFLNPIFLYFANLVNSDALFAALSLLWLAELLWIMHRPNLYHFIIQAILLFLCFTIRNNAYYYPLIAALAFILSRQKTRLKLIGIALPFLFIVPFIIHTRNVSYKMTSSYQFSLFTGWQLANNALYAYPYIHVDSTKLPSIQARELNRLSGQFYKSTKPAFRDYLSGYEGNFFIRDLQSPLRQYFENHYGFTDEYDNVIAWGKASTIYSEYGVSLIKQNPFAYLKGFVLLNVKNYFVPPLNNLEVYNQGDEVIRSSAQDWFDYKTPDVTAISKTAQKYVLYIFPFLFLFANLYLFGGLFFLAFRKQIFRENSEQLRLIALSAALILINMGFSVFSTINIFRYQLVPMIVCLSSCLLILKLVDKKEFGKDPIIPLKNKTEIGQIASIG
jgi:hypothetical protein